MDKSEENEPDSISKPVGNHEPKCRTYDLNELIDGITPENRHDEMDFGKPMGEEAW
jgi:antitoxin component of MazEF toxin-antitoxin module